MTASTGEGRDQELQHTELHKGAIPADTFGNRLVLSRTHAGHLSIREAADMCGLNRGSWQGWERGLRPRDIIDVVDRIADKLGIDRDWLLFGGALTPSRGKPTKRTGGDTHGYHKRTVRASARGRVGRPRTGSPAQLVRRPRLIDRSQPVAA